VRVRGTLAATCLALLAAAALAAPAGGQGYVVPPDNPFVNTPGARGEIWVYGMRNPFRWSFDSATGDMYVGDVGGLNEEITFLPRAAQAGANLGWNCFSGTAVQTGCAAPGHVLPAFQYPSGPDVVIGGTVVHDPTLPAFQGRYVYGRFDSGLKLLGPGAAPPEADGPDIPAVSAINTDGLGHLYATSLGGGLYRLVQNGSQLEATKVGDFAQPVGLAAPPGDPGRLFVVEKAGRVRNLDGSLFVDIADLVADGGEQGLLAMAVAPDYAVSGRVFLFYTDNGGDLQVDELVRTASGPDRADVSTRRSILTVQHDQAGNHNGGQLAFGPDGMLYLSTGDGGTHPDPEGDAQSLGSLLGKIVRLDVFSPRPVAPPPLVAPPADTTAPTLRTRIRRRQRVLRLRGAVAYARCNEACSVRAVGALAIGRRRLAMRPAVRAAQVGDRTRLRVRLTRRGTRVLRRALRRGRRPVVRLRLRAADEAGNPSPVVRRSVRVRR
jgi:glucose/arabinose dehydrogenase